MNRLEGCEVRYVAEPADVDELCVLMTSAHEKGLTVVPTGSGSKLGWLDLPPVIDVLLDLGAFTSFRFDPAGGEVIAGAAMRVAAVQDELARHGRRLALDPPSHGATIGGTLVSAEAGPMAHMFGPPAAHVVDATVVLPDGTLSKVADRVRLLGSSVCDLRWAHPGPPHPASVVVEAALRTVALPQSQAWLTFPVTQPLHVAEQLEVIHLANVSPAAIELDLPGIRMGAVVPGQRHARGMLAVLVEGADVSVADRARELSALLGPRAHITDQMPHWWGRYPFRPGEVAIRLHTPDGLLHLICYTLADAAGAPVPVRGSLGAGPAWAALPGDMPPSQMTAVLDAAREVLLARGGSAVVQAAPRQLREVIAPYRQP
jgi:glycolate dehydrogenase FAD-binding subunit